MQSTAIAPAARDAASRILCRAFQEDPMLVHIVPDPGVRERVMPWFFDVTLRYGMLYGHVQVRAEQDGAAIWLTPGNTTMTPWRMVRTGLMSAPFKFGIGGFQRMMDIVGTVEKAHKRLAAGEHWYLMGIGVDPSRQGRGVGSALLSEQLQRIDTVGLPTYLETMNADNLPFYRRHGFEVGEQVQIPNGPFVWAMLRPGRRP